MRYKIRCFKKTVRRILKILFTFEVTEYLPFYCLWTQVTILNFPNITSRFKVNLFNFTMIIWPSLRRNDYDDSLVTA